MSLNRYRMNHLRRSQHAGATRASKLLEKPDKLIGVILIGNNFVNFLAASIASSIAILILGEPAPFATAIALTLVVLIFAEVTPKTIAALYPERIAYPSSIVLGYYLKCFTPWCGWSTSCRTCWCVPLDSTLRRMAATSNLIRKSYAPWCTNQKADCRKSDRACC